MSVDISALTVDRELGMGGYGVVHRVLGTPLVGDARPMVLKRPKPGLDPIHIPTMLEGMRRAVQFRDSLTLQDRQQIDEISAWPVAMVSDGRREVGCLLPLIPPTFFMDIPAKGNSPAEQKQRVIGYLAAPTKARNQVGYENPDFQDDAMRLHVLSKLARAIELLHQHGMVFGDLNPNNEVFTFAPTAVMLLDCDAVAHISDGTRASRQGHFPRWKPPEMDETAPAPKKLQDFETDVFKLGLAFARYIQGAAGATQRLALPTPTPQVVSPQLTALLTRALDPQPAARPSASEIRQAAEAAVSAVVAPPVVSQTSLNKFVALRYSDVLVSWSLHAGSPYEVEIESPGGQRKTAQAGTNELTIRVVAAGEVLMHVRTKYASVTHLVGRIDCYELPAFNVQTGLLPIPQIPVMTAFTAPSILRRDSEIQIPTLPSSLNGLMEKMTETSRSAPTVEGFGTNIINAIHESGVHSLGANLIGSFPLPDTISLKIDLVETLHRQFANAIGAEALPSSQAMAYTRVIQDLAEQVAALRKKP